MTAALGLACLWLAAANIIAMFPSKHQHWPAAYALIAIGLPLLVCVYLANGIIVAGLVLLAGASVLRWPVLYLWRWLRRKFATPQNTK